ncbi:MAG TPA: acetyl-CoA carboxylase biotin carboxyl carrier protein [Candidatus Merdenecus merdavium]|nr:acetyl-CoA carboxylase biotin carboxyl carrier protein [Candidatus Merdenecus merdavium]
MEFNKIKELIEAVSSSTLTEFELRDGEVKIKMKTNKEVTPKNECVQRPQEKSTVLSTLDMDENNQQESINESSGQIVASPLVGTFYSASSPESHDFVKVGDSVKKGDVLGIIEAMKLMNEIECEVDGVITQILVSNEQIVEYGQPLFMIESSAL